MLLLNEQQTISLELAEIHFNFLDIGIVMLDDHLRICFLNKWLRHRIPESISVGYPLKDLYRGRDSDIIINRVEKALKYHVVQVLSPILNAYIIPIPDDRFDDGYMKQKGLFIPMVFKDAEGVDRKGVLIQIIDVSHMLYQLELLDNVNRIKNKEIEHRKSVEQKLEISLQEKETLLREIHHRVKNNMQVVSSLLKMQMRKTKDSTTEEALHDCRLRIQSMAFIHETLYSSGNVASINIGSYISRLTKSIAKSFHSKHGAVDVIISTEKIMLGIDQANSLGLVINELVTNSFKYAFKPGKPGKVEIILEKKNPFDIEIVIKDNGIGLPDGCMEGYKDGLGLNLVKLIIENQLGGTVACCESDGACFQIKLKAGPASDT